MDRRDFIKLLTVTGIGSTLPFSQWAFAAAQPTLPIPPILTPDANGAIHLKLQTGECLWANTPTKTWGVNGPLLGPAIKLQRGQKVRMEIENTLPETTAIHWHGVEVPGTVDGGPQAMIAPGTTWKPELTIDQAAATCWFHPHPHGITGRHVAMGLGGLLLIEDETNKKLPIPSHWGVDDVPVIIQDKKLNATNQIDYKLDAMSAAVGWFGDLPLTNGTVYPVHSAPRGWIRLRFLNGCNARSLRLACSDKRAMYVIASDGGFLAEPVQVKDLQIFTGERFEVLVDCRDGKAFDILTIPVVQMGMTVAPFDKALPLLHIQPNQAASKGSLPDTLVTIPAIPKLSNLKTRMFHLTMDARLDEQGMKELMERYGHGAMAGISIDAHSTMGYGGHGSGSMNTMGTGNMGMSHDMNNSTNNTMPHGNKEKPFDLMHSNFINGEAFTMNKASFNVPLDSYERWIISGMGDMMLHPFHIHGTQFQIIKENGATPAPHRQGRKDIVFVEGKMSEVLVHFNHPAPQERMFMAHCHLLEHEDTGMMTSFTVS